MKKPARHGVVNGRNAIGALATQFVAAELELVLAVIHEAANKQIEPPIVVVIEPDSAGRPSGCRNSCACCDVCECTVAVVVVQNALRILGHIQVGESIAVVVTDCNTHPVRVSTDTSFQSDICESAVAIIAVKSIAQRLRRTVKIARPARSEE